MELLIPIFAVLGTFGAVITSVYMSNKAKHAERMALIESGQTADIFAEKNYHQGERGLKTGLFLIGGGLGFILGRLIESGLDWDEGSGAFPMTLVGAGVGLVIFYILMSKRHEDYN